MMASPRTTTSAPAAPASLIEAITRSTVASRSRRTGVACTAATVMVVMPWRAPDGSALRKTASGRSPDDATPGAMDNGHMSAPPGTRGLLGRDDALGRLGHLVAATSAGRRATALVTGEAGIGK